MFNNLRQKLLGSKSENAPSSIAVSIYGKLPIYKDYIQVGCNEKRSSEFKHWLEEAFGQPYEIFDGRTVPIEAPRKLLCSLSDGKSIAIATIWPSTDEGGLRKFPFTAFAILPRTIFDNQPLVDLWPTLHSIWNQFSSIYDQAKSLQDISALYEKYKEPHISIDQTPETSASDPLDFRNWFNAFEPDFPQIYADSLTNNIRKFLEIYRELESENYTPAVRLPMAPETNIPRQADIWLKVFSTALKNCRKFPTMVLPFESTDKQEFVCLIWREIRNEDGFLFAATQVEYEYIDDLDIRLLTHDNTPRIDMSITIDQWIELLAKP